MSCNWKSDESFLISWPTVSAYCLFYGAAYFHYFFAEEALRRGTMTPSARLAIFPLFMGFILYSAVCCPLSTRNEACRDGGIGKFFYLALVGVVFCWIDFNVAGCISAFAILNAAVGPFFAAGLRE